MEQALPQSQKNRYDCEHTVQMRAVIISIYAHTRSQTIRFNLGSFLYPEFGFTWKNLKTLEWIIAQLLKLFLAF